MQSKVFLRTNSIATIGRLLRRTLVRSVVLTITFDVNYCYQVLLFDEPTQSCFNVRVIKSLLQGGDGLQFTG
jgi:ABC-type cobalamin transport system ATPase subunit